MNYSHQMSIKNYYYFLRSWEVSMYIVIVLIYGTISSMCCSMNVVIRMNERKETKSGLFVLRRSYRSKTWWCFTRRETNICGHGCVLI